MANILKSIRGRLLGLTGTQVLESPGGFSTTPQTITSTATAINPYGTTIINSTGTGGNIHSLTTPAAGDVGVFKHISVAAGTSSTGCVVQSDSTGTLITASNLSTGQTLTSTSTGGGWFASLQYISTGRWQLIGGSSALNAA